MLSRKSFATAVSDCIWSVMGWAGKTFLVAAACTLLSGSVYAGWNWDQEGHLSETVAKSLTEHFEEEYGPAADQFAVFREVAWTGSIGSLAAATITSVHIGVILQLGAGLSL